MIRALKRVGTFVLLAVTTFLCLAGPATAQSATNSYTVTDLGTLGGLGSEAYGINSTGQVTGLAAASSSYCYAFLSSGSSMTNLGTLGGSGSIGWGINASGVVVGYSMLSDGVTQHAFAYSSGSMTDLGTLPGSNNSYAYSINTNGDIVGGSDIDPVITHPFLYQSGSMSDLGTLGGTYSEACSINDACQIVGRSTLSSGVTHAFLWQSGSMTDIGTIFGLGDKNGTTQAWGINNSGQIVGMSYGSAFLYESGTMTNIGAGHSFQSMAWAINNSGCVVGEFYVGGNTHAFLYRSGVFTDLNDLVSPSASWTLRCALGINDRGQIVGYGDNPDGYDRAFLLTPLLNISATTLSNYVYQNTPTTTMDRHYLTMTTSVTGDTWGNTTYTASVSVSPTPSGTYQGLIPSSTFVDQNGSGAVTTTNSFSFAAGTAGTIYLVGGRALGDTGSGGVVNSVVNKAVGKTKFGFNGQYTVTVTVVGDVSGPSNPATTTLTITLLRLGDATATGSITGTIATYINLYIGSGNLSPNVYNADTSLLDLEGSGVVESEDATLINEIVAGYPIP